LFGVGPNDAVLHVCGGKVRDYPFRGLGKYDRTLAPGADVLPDANALIKNALTVIDVGSRVGILDYVWPHPGKNAVEVAVVAVGTGRNNRARWFTVFERIT